MASSINNSDAVIALTGSQKKVDAASDNLDVGPDIGVDQTVNQTSIDNAPSADVPLLLDADDNQNNLTYSKEYEAVLQIKQQLESKRNLPIGRRRSRFNFDWLFIREPREYKLLAFIITLFCVIISGLIVVYHFHEEDMYYVYHGPHIKVNEKTLDIEVLNASAMPVLKGRLWRTRPNGRLPYDCSKSMLPDEEGLCLIWKKLQLLHVKHYIKNNATCFDVRWKAFDKSVRHMDCYQLESAGHWYGAGLLSVQLWPLERTSFNKQLFVTGTFHDRNSFGSVVERYWVTSSGVAITVADNSPLHVSINSRPVDEHGLPTSNDTDHQLCLYADNTPELNYTICVGDNIRHVHESVADSFADESVYRRLPMSLLNRPVWSTWSLYKDNFNQSSLVSFAEKIKSSKFNEDGALLLVDDGWEERYGDMKFNRVKFNDPQQMINDLHTGGFQVSLWFHPQLNTDSASFQQATANGFLIRDISGDVPGLTRWWNGPHSTPWSRGVAGLVDVSDTGAIQWHRNRIIDFQKRCGVDNFHLAGGETVSWPLHSTVFTHVFSDPNDFTYHIAKLISSLSKPGDLTIIQSAYRCQHLPVLIRISQGSSSWYDIGGLRSVIPSALSLSLIGYPFFIPEAIGGSAFNGPPSRELYIRWLQLAAFLPIMHFSIPPDYYDAETVSIAEKMISLHNELVVPTVVSLINESATSLSPIVRPLWWLAPTEHDALVTDTQFMVGDTILVAPVVEQGARHRNIYLPSGKWQDKITELVYTGPLLLTKYPVPLNQIAYFVRSI